MLHTQPELPAPETSVRPAKVTRQGTEGQQYLLVINPCRKGMQRYDFQPIDCWHLPGHWCVRFRRCMKHSRRCMASASWPLCHVTGT